MMNLNERIEVIASKSKAREIYDQYLHMLLQHMEVIKIVSDNYETVRSIKFLAETYAVASIASNADAKDQIMYDILREIAYRTALSKDYTTHVPDDLSFVLANASIIIENAKKDIKSS